VRVNGAPVDVNKGASAIRVAALIGGVEPEVDRVIRKIVPAAVLEFHCVRVGVGPFVQFDVELLVVVVVVVVLVHVVTVVLLPLVLVELAGFGTVVRKPP